MKLVADTNVLVSCFKINSTAKKIILSRTLMLYTPERALEEINKHRDNILKRTGISSKEFDEILVDIAESVEIIPIKDYADSLKIESPDPDDLDFMAVASHLNIPLWSQEKRLKKQDKVSVFSTEELITDFLDILFPNISNR